MPKGCIFIFPSEEFMFKGFKHLYTGSKLLYKGFEHMFQGFEHKMYRGENYFLYNVRNKILLPNIIKSPLSVLILKGLFYFSYED